MPVLRKFLFGLLTLGLPACGTAQVRSNLRSPLTPLRLAEAVPPASIEEELHAMSGQAGVIFAGEVVAIRPQGDAGTGWVDIEFRVEEAIRGCVGQATYRLREWAGLWTGGVQRYQVGERLLLLLHVPSATGMSSPVGGQDGMIPLLGDGPSPQPDDSFVAAGEQAVDLRWIEARVLRTAQSSHGSGAHGRPAVPIQAGYVGRNVTLRRDASLPQAPPVFETSVAQSADELGQKSTLRVVLAMLGAWETEQANAVR